MRAGPVLALAVGAAFVLGGCQYLFGLTPLPPGPFPMESFDPSEFASIAPDYTIPPPLAAYKRGNASVTIDGKTTKLNRVQGSLMPTEYGTEATWSDGNGLFFRIIGSGEPGDAYGWYVVVDRIRDGAHWTTAEATTCAVNVTQADVDGLAGSTTCQRVRWVDAMANFRNGEPTFVDDVAPFAMKVTFRASP